MAEELFRSVGGVPVKTIGDSGQGDGEAIVWNFGLAVPVGVAKNLEERKTVYESAPYLKGRWDRKTDISIFEVAKRVLGNYIPAQRQTAGTCGSRAMSGLLNHLQCVQIAAGLYSEYKPVSHAWIYGGAREINGILGGGDGVIPPSPITWCQKKGVLTQAEAKDEDYYSDSLAVKWGRSGCPRDLLKEAADNIVVEAATCKSFDEAADVIASGGLVAVASNRGFNMTRDKYGVCKPQGSWAHYMFFGSVHKLADGREVLGCAQSWGQNVPDGPTLPMCPDYVFGVEKSVVDRDMLGLGDSTAVSGFQAWGMPKIPWVFEPHSNEDKG